MRGAADSMAGELYGGQEQEESNSLPPDLRITSVANGPGRKSKRQRRRACLRTSICCVDSSQSLCRACSVFRPARPRRTRISSSTKATRARARGKHIVFLAGDHEYRSEESLPALARIMAKHYGFKCSVFFTTDPQTGFIEPGQLEHRRARGAEDRRPAGRLPAVPGFPRRPRCSTSPTTWIAADRSSASAPRRMPSRSSGPTRSS